MISWRQHFAIDDQEMVRRAVAEWGRDSIYRQWVATGAQLQSRRRQQAVRYWVEPMGRAGLDLSPAWSGR
jgi:hypothetical protein